MSTQWENEKEKRGTCGNVNIARENRVCEGKEQPEKEGKAEDRGGEEESLDPKDFNHS